jgi:hypothetical protein
VRLDLQLESETSLEIRLFLHRVFTICLNFVEEQKGKTRSDTTSQFPVLLVRRVEEDLRSGQVGPAQVTGSILPPAHMLN